jgi:hypothetical protein
MLNSFTDATVPIFVSVSRHKKDLRIFAKQSPKLTPFPANRAALGKRHRRVARPAGEVSRRARGLRLDFGARPEVLHLVKQFSGPVLRTELPH